jgi:hypothetical protein
MHAEKAEDNNKQRSHRPESEIEDRIFLFVMMGCVSQISGESAVSIRMAFLAGLNNLPESNVRIWVVDFPDVV